MAELRFQHPQPMKNYSSILSELLMCSTALGAGVVPPFDELYDESGMIFASAVSDQFKSRMRRASAAFNQATAAEERVLRRRVQSLETDLVDDVPGTLDELTLAREQMIEQRYPYCNDYAATRDLLLELAARSRHKHITVMDDQGFRLGMSLKYSPTFSRESTLLSLTVGYGLNQAITRAHGTGDIKVTTLGNGLNPPCTYFSSPPAALVKKMSDKLCSSTILSPLQGYAVVIAEEPVSDASIDATTEDIVKLLDTYYTIGHKPESERASFVLQSDELRVAWEQFLTGDDVFKILEIPDNRIGRAAKLLKHWNIKPKVAAAYATRAAFCKAALETVKIEHNANLLKIALRDRHLEQAIEFFKELYRELSVKVQAAERLAENAEKARAVRSDVVPSPAKQEAAIDALMTAIESSPNRMISRDAAIRTHNVSPALLDYIVANSSTLTELCGREQINMGKTKRAYALKADTFTDVGESIDDFNEAEEIYALEPSSSMFDEMETVRHELMVLAKVCDRGLEGLPAIPITKLTSRQLRCLPPILARYTDCFAIRGTSKFPELPHLVKSVTDPDAPLEPDVPTVWVRRAKDGKPFRDWKIAVKLGFSEAWSE